MFEAWTGIWKAINEYAEACGADPEARVHGNTARQRAVVSVERALDEFVSPSEADLRKALIAAQRSIASLEAQLREAMALPKPDDLETMSRIMHMEREIHELRVALDYYARESNWGQGPVGATYRMWKGFTGADGWQLARRTLDNWKRR